jgi:hypothetical protein
MNMAYVSGRFDVARRRPGLSFSHHAELAGLGPEDQELWLDRIQASGLSVRALRLELRKARRRSAARLAAGLPTAEGDERRDDETIVMCPHCGNHFTLESSES